MQYTIEADGLSVYPCEFYVLDKYRLGDLSTDLMETISRKAEESKFISNKDELCNSIFRNKAVKSLILQGISQQRQVCSKPSTPKTKLNVMTPMEFHNSYEKAA